MKRLIASIAAATAMGFAGMTNADVLVLNDSSNDLSFVRSDGSNADNVNGGSRLLIGTTGPSGGAFRAVGTYDISAIPAGNIITSVTVNVVQRDIDGSTTADVNNFEVAIATISDAVDETTATWNNTFGAAVDPLVLGAPLSTVVLDTNVAVGEGDLPPLPTVTTFASTPELVAAVQAALDSDGLFNFALYSPNFEAGDARRLVRFISDDSEIIFEEDVIGNFEIVIESVVPEPGSVALLSSGAVMLLRRRR